MVGVLGMITGAGIFVAAYNWLQPIILALGDFGKATIPEVMDLPAPFVIIALATVLLVLFERSRRKGQKTTLVPSHASDSNAHSTKGTLVR